MFTRSVIVVHRIFVKDTKWLEKWFSLRHRNNRHQFNSFAYSLVNKTNLVHNFPYMFIYILYMFRATMCPSSGEITVTVRHLVFVTLCGWPSGMQDPILHTRWSSTQSDKFQVSHWYSNFSWWWAHSCPKHVENRNKHTRKIVHQVGFIYKIC